MNPTGSLPVGVADLAATLPGPDVDRLAARLFYPCQRSWTLPCTWIPHINYARGYIGYVFKLVPQKNWRTELARSALVSAAWALGGSRVLPVYYNAPAAAPATAPGPFPVVVFSHGLAGARNAYSSICIELASQGYVVVALEHSDGSASCARLPARTARTRTRAPAATASCSSSEPVAAAASAAGSDEAATDTDADSRNGLGSASSEWCFYAGFGDREEQLRKTRHRVAEVAAVYGLLERLQRGSVYSAGADGDGGGGDRAGGSPVAAAVVRELPATVADSLRGRLDLHRAAVMGHSYGGATAAAAAASLPYFRAAVSLDPWWGCFDDEWPVLRRWSNPPGSPLLVIGSEDWNTPNPEGRLKCDGARQERVLAAAAAGGGGAVLAVPRGSTHSNFDDVMLLFGKSLSALLRLFNIRSSLEPRRAHSINMWCITHFLTTHLPPTPTPAASSKEGGAAEAPQRTTAAAAAMEPAESTLTLPRPVLEGDLAAYREHLGGWLEMLRLAAAERTDE